MLNQEDMIHDQIEVRGIKDPELLDALRRVPREKFIPAAYRHFAYDDRPIPIGYGQTISQPFIVAYMIRAIDLQPDEKVLEIGTGCGYNAAVLAQMAREVFSIERIPELSHNARETLTELGYTNVHLRVGDGYKGWREHAPFDAIILTAAPPEAPQELLDQLADGGRLIVPEGEEIQTLRVYHRRGNRIEHQDLIGVRFVPMLKN